MVEKIIIAAVAENNIIGKDGKIPWHIPGDLAYFKRFTLGNCALMGRKTYESLPKKYRPLPDRKNIILTRDKEYAEKGITIVYNLDDALKHCNGLKLFIAGGSEIYKKFIPLVDRLEITRIHKKYDGDVRFPIIDPAIWQVREEQFCRGEPSYTLQTYKRRK